MEKIGSKFQKLWSLVQGPRFARMPRNTLKRLKKQTLIRKIFLTLKRLLHLVNRKAPPITPIFFHKCNSSSKLVPNYQWKWRNLNSGTIWSAQGKKILRRPMLYLQTNWKSHSPYMASRRKNELFSRNSKQTLYLFSYFWSYFLSLNTKNDSNLKINLRNYVIF